MIYKKVKLISHCDMTIFYFKGDVVDLLKTDNNHCLISIEGRPLQWVDKKNVRYLNNKKVAI